MMSPIAVITKNKQLNLTSAPKHNVTTPHKVYFIDFSWETPL